MAKEYENGTDRFVFIYDKEGKPHELHYYSGYDDTTPTKYFYVLNLQGDVIQLRDTSNAVVANYTYDAWGRLLSVKNESGATITDATHIANVNPIRYRGYFYDTETKLHYCNSRYYDPQIKRFINADVYLSTDTGFLGYNMFAYCENNPVMYYDPSGCFAVAIPLSEMFLTKMVEILLGLAVGGLAYECGKAWSLEKHKYEVNVEIVESNYYPEPESTTSAIDSLRRDVIRIHNYPTPPLTTAQLREEVIDINSKNVLEAKEYDPDPYARPGQKKQNRERKEKKKKKNWDPNPNKKILPPKKHTPGRDHRKY